MNTTDQSPSISTVPPSSRVAHIARTLALALLVVAAGFAFQLLFPGHAFAQDTDPFAETETKFTAFLNRLKFWVWGMSALGLAFYVIAYGGQALWPSWYGSMRDFLRNGAILLVVFNAVFAFLLKQATDANKVAPPAGILTVLPTLLHLIR